MITKRQHDMLAAISAEKSINPTALISALGLGRNGQVAQNIEYNLSSLIEKGLIKLDSKSGFTHKYYCITDAGMDALYRNETRSPTAAKPNRINIFAQETYAPPKLAYYRNTGNTHIASRGFEC